jgi:Caspase domain
MTLVFDKPMPRQATHAIVIGVGAYNHLVNGTGSLYVKNEGMAQLNSPPISARQFAFWLIDKYCNQEKPLASLDLLISDDLSNDFYLPSGHVVQNIERATWLNVRTAILNRWFVKGNSDPDNMVIFYFCGHGVSRSMMSSLLLEDYGSQAVNPLQEAIDFNSFYVGMDKCAARKQVFILDCCQNTSDALIEEYENYAGDKVIPGKSKYSELGGRCAPAYFAAIPGQTTYGRIGKMSVYTEALIRSLDGGGSNFIGGQWQITTNRLQDGIEEIIHFILKNQDDVNMFSTMNGWTKFPLHILNNDPIIPISIHCLPSKANKKAVFGYYPVDENPANAKKRDPDPSDWDLDLEIGDYQVLAEFQSGNYHNVVKRITVFPPVGDGTLEVA